MATSWFNRLLKKSGPLSRSGRNQSWRGRFVPSLEVLGERVLPSVTASFAGGLLRVIGDDQDNVITVSRDVAGTILVNNGAVVIQGDPGASVTNTTHINIVGAGGNDTISLDETNGALPAAALFGGDGNDTLTGGSGNDFIDGGPGSDTAFLGAGDDDFQWNPGDGSDVVEGQGGQDTLTFNGSDLAEKFDISANGSRVLLTRDVGNITMDLNGIEAIDLDAFGSADTITVNDTSATDLLDVNLDLNGMTGQGDGQADAVILNGTNGNDLVQVSSPDGLSIRANVGLSPQVTITGAEAGSDTLTVNALGGDDQIDASLLGGAPVVFGASPADVIGLTLNGGPGNDTLIGSQGDDTFTWSPGDGSDTIDGQAGTDRLVFTGSDEAEKFDISANGTHAQLTRDVGTIAMDLDNVEDIDLDALGGADTITVNDLSATNLFEVNVNLANSAGSADGQSDSVILNGNDQDTALRIAAALDNPAEIVAKGFSPLMTITGADARSDVFTVNALDGNDDIDASALPANLIGLVINGGAGNDTILGSQGADLVNGGPGADVAQLGDGNDTFVWNPGDGSDTVDGQAGSDRLVFNGADAAEKFDVSANGSRVRFSRDFGGITMDLGGVETIDVNALGGADTITVNDLTATDLTAVDVNLVSSAGTGDGQADAVIINGTNEDDHIQIMPFASGTRVAVLGLSARVNIAGSDGPADHLTVNALGGNDVVDASGLPGNLIGLTVNLGDGQAAVATTTTLRTSAVSVAAGQSVLLTATVSSLTGTPAGIVTFLDGGMVLGSAPVDNAGRAALSVSLAVGSHTLTASFAGAAGFANSISAAVTETVNFADANSRFVDQLYRDLLNRPSDPDGLAFWTAHLAQGITRTQVAAGIESSVEYDTIAVQKAYQRFLRRAPEQAGLTFWVQALQGGLTIEEMEVGIVGSLEYFQTHGHGLNANFLAALYQDVLGRAIDPSGQDSFGQQLSAGAGRAQVAAAIFASAEFRQDLVTSDYQELLNRAPDNAGLAFFTGALQTGETDQQIAAQIAGSDEFFARLQ